MMMTRISRRQFMKATAAAGTAVTVLPRRVFGANERLNIAAIGIGGIAGQNIRACADENIVALCDVDSNYAGKVFDAYPMGAISVAASAKIRHRCFPVYIVAVN